MMTMMQRKWGSVQRSRSFWVKMTKRPQLVLMLLKRSPHPHHHHHHHLLLLLLLHASVTRPSQPSACAEQLEPLEHAHLTCDWVQVAQRYQVHQRRWLQLLTTTK